MEDVSYFTKSIVHVEDIVQLAQEQGYPCILMPFQRMADKNASVNHLDVEVDFLIERGNLASPSLSNEHWYISEEVEDDYGFWNPDDIKRIKDSAHVSAITFDYHVASLPVLGRFLTLVLERYGG